MCVTLPLKFHFKILATMNNKKQDKKPLFAEVNLTGDEFKQSPSNHIQRSRFLKLVYPNDVTLILPGDISASQLEQYIRIKI
jgi:hypothetical protein